MPEIIRLQKFLIAFDLEAGGLVIAWFNFIVAVIVLIILILVILFTMFVSCPENITSKVEGISNNLPDEENISFACTYGKFMIVFILTLITVFIGVIAFICYRCIQGIKMRDPVKITPMLVWMAIGAVLSFLQILSFTFSGFTSGVSGLVIDGYCFLVLHSLRENFREEIAQGINMQIKQHQNPPPQYAESSANAGGFTQQPDPSYSQSYQQQAYNP